MKKFRSLTDYISASIVRTHIALQHDIEKNIPIIFLDDQLIVSEQCIFICSAKTLKSRLKHLSFENECIIFVADSGSFNFCTTPYLKNVTVVETNIGAPKLYNMLRVAISSIPLDENQGDKNSEIPSDLPTRLRIFWENVRNEKLSNNIEIREALSLIGIHAKKYVRLIILSSDKSVTSYDALAGVEKKIKGLMPNSVVIPSGPADKGELIILRFYEEQNFASDMYEEEIINLLKKENCRIAFGNSTRYYDMLNSQYVFTKRTLDLARMIGIDPDERAFHFDRYSIYYIIDLCAQSYAQKFKNTDILRLVNPIIVHITRYDATHNTNLRDVLYNYLANNRNLQSTADALHMHRNTVLNKLNTIKEISPIDFKDGGLCERLMFSCQVALYYEKVLRHQITIA